MNFALPAIFVFLVVLPGFLFRSRLKIAEQTSLDYSPFGRVVTEAVLWAFALHLLGIGVAAAFGQPVRADTVLGLLSSSPALQESAVASTSASAGRVLWYFAILYAAAFVVPSFVRAAISRYRLDRAGSRFSPIFRFHQAPWYYLLSDADLEQDEISDYILVAAIIDVAGQPYLYTGILDGFFFTPDGTLDRLVLEQVSRRPLAKDKTPDDAGRFYPIDGDYFVIRYSEAITLNVHYVKLRDAIEDD